MKLRKSEIMALGIILFAFLSGVYFYPQLPEQIASHWNINGQVDGYTPKFWGTFIMPIISVFLFLLLVFLPKIDPKSQNIEKFRNYFDQFIVAIFSFLLYLYLLTLAWNLNYRFNMVQFLVPAFAVLFYVLGNLIANAEQNWTIGLRTPWTLSNQAVWDKTNKLGGQLFKLAGLVALIGFLFPQIAFWLVIGPILIFSLFITFYSYWLYRQEKSKA